MPQTKAYPGNQGMQTMTIRALALAALVSFAAVATAVADERIDFTPPLHWEHARPTAAVRQTSQMTTTPSVVRSSEQAPRRIVEATIR